MSGPTSVTVLQVRLVSRSGHVYGISHVLLACVSRGLALGFVQWNSVKFIKRFKVSHIATDNQSVGLSWCRAPSGAHDKIFAYLFNLLKVTVLSMGAPSLTRGRVCRLSVSHLCDIFVRIIYNVYTKHITYNRMKCLMYSIYKASVSPGLVQQIMSYS
jgi:hypothetical protein